MLIGAIILTVISILLSIILIVVNYIKQNHPDYNFKYSLIIRILASLLFVGALILYYFAFKGDL